MQGNRQHKSGQAIIFLMVVMVIGILAVVWSYDLHRVVNAKLRMRNAGDAAALAAARWQGHALNMIGDLNLIQAAMIASDPTGGGADPMLHELRARLDYIGPLAAFAVAQQAAFNNGALPDPDLASNLLEMAEVYRDEVGWEPYPDAREEYADLLENIAVRGAAVSSYQVSFRPRNHPLVQELFYWSIAEAIQGRWCPMKKNRFAYHLEHYVDFESWPELNSELTFGQMLDLQLDELYSSDNGIPPNALAGEDEYRELFGPYLTGLDFVQNYGARFPLDGTAAWHVYSSSWNQRWPRPAEYDDETSPRSLKPLAIRDRVRDEYNYLGAVSGISMAATVHRGILSSSGNETIGLEYKAKAKPFGFLNIEDGLAPPNLFGFVFPCFQNVRLVHSDIGVRNVEGPFFDHVTKHLKPYLENGPTACEPECAYCRLLVEWEWLDRQEGLEWLDRAYSDEDNNPCEPEYDSSEGPWGDDGGGATGGS